MTPADVDSAPVAGTARTSNAATQREMCVDCDICSSRNGQLIHASERMFGMGGAFDYFECGNCGRLQLVNAPSSLSRFYPPAYYSFQPSRSDERSRASAVRRWFARKRNAATLFRHRGIGVPLAILRPNPRASELRALISSTGLNNYDARILDIGCGSGQLLYRLGSIGFKRLIGIDPFLPEDAEGSEGVELRAVPLEQVDDGPYELIMFHHSLEHMPNHHDVFRKLVDLLHQSGCCLIRMPIAPSDPLQRFGPAWVELDAPRHLSIHSVESVGRLAAQVGLKVASVKYEESAFGFWASELYVRGLTLVDPATGCFRNPEDHFDLAELQKFQSLADEANRRQRGGRAAIILRHA